MFSIRGKANADTARQAAAKAGLDWTRLEQDIQSERVERHITNSFLLAEHMGLMGTPSFVAGDEGAFGKYSLDDLKGLVQRARETLG